MHTHALARVLPKSWSWCGAARGAAAAARPGAPALSICPLQVLKVAILAEKYAVDYTWYVDTILNLIRIAGDYVSEEVWYRVIQIVINRDDVQGYAAKTVFEVWSRCPPLDKAWGSGGYCWPPLCLLPAVLRGPSSRCGHLLAGASSPVHAGSP